MSASAPPTTTRTVARFGSASPSFAPVYPVAANATSTDAKMAGTFAGTGTSIATRNGSKAPSRKDANEAKAACQGLTTSSSLR